MIKKETKSRYFILVETFDDFVLLSPSFEFFGKTHQNVNCFRLSELCDDLKLKQHLTKRILLQTGSGLREAKTLEIAVRKISPC